MADALVRGIQAPVLLIDFEEQLPEALELHMVLMDDAYWAGQVRRPFSWPLFWRWWIARRWIVPRDPRRE